MGSSESGLSELWEKLQGIFFKFRFSIIVTFMGLILVGLGTFFVKTEGEVSGDRVEVLKSATESQERQIFVEVSGAVQKPGVYSFDGLARVEDALVAAGGFSEKADRQWVDRTLNRASKLVDGQKIYIPHVSEQSLVSSANNQVVYQNGSSTFGASDGGLININTASSSELQSLNGIGPAYGQKIIDQRPYSNIDELLTKKVIPKNTYEKIKDRISVY